MLSCLPKVVPLPPNEPLKRYIVCSIAGPCWEVEGRLINKFRVALSNS
jgi:hypothetical protein